MIHGTPVASSTQNVWDEIRQDTMRNTSKTAPDGQEASPREVAVVSINPDDFDGDGVVSAIEKAKALQKSRGTTKPSSEPQAPETVESSLKNVGPNTFEKIRINAGRTYLAQAANHAGSNADNALGLNLSA